MGLRQTLDEPHGFKPRDPRLLLVAMLCVVAMVVIAILWWGGR